MAGRLIIAAVSLFIFLIAPPAQAQAASGAGDGIIGTIIEVDGSGTVTPAGGGKAMAAAVDTPVHLNDVVQTASKSRIFILFIDNTQLTLSEDTQISLDNYIFDQDNNTNNKAAYSVMQGAFQYVSGLIGKKDNPDVHINTPVGSMGIRGTDFWAGTLDGQYSLAVNDGQVALTTDAGETVVNKGQGTSVKDRHSKPAAAQAWGQDKFKRIAATVNLQKNRYQLNKMISDRQGYQQFLRNRYKAFMLTRSQSAPPPAPAPVRSNEKDVQTGPGKQQKFQEKRNKFIENIQRKIACAQAATDARSLRDCFPKLENMQKERLDEEITR